MGILYNLEIYAIDGCCYMSVMFKIGLCKRLALDVLHDWMLTMAKIFIEILTNLSRVSCVDCFKSEKKSRELVIKNCKLKVVGIYIGIL